MTAPDANPAPNPEKSPSDSKGSDKALARWRLILGKFAEDSLSGGGGQGQQYTRMDRVLDQLYGREYGGRGIRDDGSDSGRPGGSGDSIFNVPTWINEVRELFPEDVTEQITGHALDRYGLTDLVTDAETLESMKPSYELMKTVLSFRGMMQGRVLDVARNLIRHVVEDLKKVLEQEVKRHLSGKPDRNKRSFHKRSRDLHVKNTIRANLRRWDGDKKQLLASDLRFFSRMRRSVTWDIIICIDCSGSMADSVIHSAVMAGIFAALPGLRIKLVVFDTNIIDLSDHADDPVEVLMSVQLGGGTFIDKAVTYCASLVEQPSKTIMVLVTDFYEGGDARALLRQVKELCGAGVKFWGLTALDQDAQPVYDHDLAGRCADAGASVAALTPGKLAEWVARVIK